MSESDVTQDRPADAPLPAPPPAPVAKGRGRIGTSFGGYEVEGELGRGGMGVVYRARQATLNRQVALKMLTGHFGEDELKRFLAEAQTAAALHHTHIVHIYEVGEIDGAVFLAAVWRKDTEWYITGVMRRRVWQACDAKRQPLSTIANHDPARTEEDFSALGKLDRKLETGFDETRLGFHSRELRIAGGQVQSVVHRHADGSPLKEVRVLVKGFLADAQPKAAAASGRSVSHRQRRAGPQRL